MKDDNNTSVYDKLFREYHLENIFVTLLIYELSFAGENFFKINNRRSKSIILKNLFEKCFDIIIKMMLHVIRKNNSIIIHKQNRKNKHCSIQKHMTHINNYQGFKNEKYKHSFSLRCDVCSNCNNNSILRYPQKISIFVSSTENCANKSM